MAIMFDIYSLCDDGNLADSPLRKFGAVMTVRGENCVASWKSTENLLRLADSSLRNTAVCLEQARQASLGRSAYPQTVAAPRQPATKNGYQIHEVAV